METTHVYGCCTAMQISGWSLYTNANESLVNQAKKKLSIVNELIKKGFFKDFALLFAITTKSQLEYKNGFTVELLEGIGFERSFSGSKDKSGQRHKETGELTMWCISPCDYEDGLLRMKKLYEDEVNKGMTPEAKRAEREKYPDFTLTDLIKNGIANLKKEGSERSTVRDSFADRIIISRSAFENHFTQKYGFNPREALGMTYWAGEILALKHYHQEWKRGEK